MKKPNNLIYSIYINEKRYDMFTPIDNRSIKQWAKSVLSDQKSNYTIWYAGAIIALVSFLSTRATSQQQYVEALGEYMTVAKPTLIASLVSTFIVPAVNVGAARFFMNVAYNKEYSLYDMAFGFFNYIKVMLTQALTGLCIVLWSLLFLVPGIIKAIAWSFVPQILAENPGVGATEAMKISAVLTDGRKGELFKFYLSFFGWFLLQAITFFAAGVYVQPLLLTAKSAVYDIMKGDAINQGRITEDVFIPNNFMSM